MQKNLAEESQSSSQATISVHDQQIEGDVSPWDLLIQPGPVMVTAIHAGHSIRHSLQPWVEIGKEERLREEYPLTDFFLPAGMSSHSFCLSPKACELHDVPETGTV